MNKCRLCGIVSMIFDNDKIYEARERHFTEYHKIKDIGAFHFGNDFIVEAEA